MTFHLRLRFSCPTEECAPEQAEEPITEVSVDQELGDDPSRIMTPLKR